MPRGERYTDAHKETARRLRGKGYTYREIIEALGGSIAKNTISDWVRDIELTYDQVARIEQIQLDARAIGRPLAAEWHREQKRQRLDEAINWAEPLVAEIASNDMAILATLAGLWAGEGEKKDDLLAISNSDPRIIIAWVKGLRRLFEIEESKFAVHLTVSNGMPVEELMIFWSLLTEIPISQFMRPQIDMREKKIKRKGYKGVCRVVYYSAEIRRKIGSLAFGIFDNL